MGASTVLGVAWKIEQWWTPKRFSIAYYKAKEELRRKGIDNAAEQLALAIGRSKKTLYKWRTGETAPDPLSCYHLDQVFRSLLGEDWMDSILDEDIGR